MPWAIASRWFASAVLVIGGLGCPSTPVADPPPTPVSQPAKSACERLVELGLRAERCDAALAQLAEQVTQAMDEDACTTALRGLIAPPTHEVPNSIYEADVVAPPRTALRDDEISSLKTIDFPGVLIITPDQAPGPGVPITHAQLVQQRTTQRASTKLTPELRFSAFSGAYDLEVRYADTSQNYCVEIRRCEETRVIAHAGHLDRHPAITQGHCQEALASYAIEP